MSVIEFEGVGKTYNPGLFKPKVRAVDSLSFSVNEGEVFGLIGPNGAGKSTSIKLLLGLMAVTEGVVRFRGELIGRSNLQRFVGYLPENPYLYDHLTLEELLVFSGRVSGLTTSEIKLRADLLSGRMGLDAAKKRRLRTYSKGMLQRAGICFALIHDPEVVVLDEPMSGLDPIGRKMVFDLVTDLKKEGKTVFFCSHILNDVERLCDRIGLLHGGRLERLFSAEQLDCTGGLEGLFMDVVTGGKA